MVYIHLSGSKVEVVVGIPETVLAHDRVGCVRILKASWFSCHFMKRTQQSQRQNKWAVSLGWVRSKGNMKKGQPLGGTAGFYQTEKDG